MGLVDEGRTLLFSIIEQCFAKKKKKKRRKEKRIKEIGFFTKICNKFVIVNNRRDSKNFFSFKCSLVTNNNILDLCL